LFVTSKNGQHLKYIKTALAYIRNRTLKKDSKRYMRNLLKLVW